MKTKIISLLTMIVSMFVLSGCDDWSPSERSFAENTGGVNLGDMDVKVNEKTNARAIPDVNDFKVEIIDKATNATAVYDGAACKWTFGQMPEVMTLPVGSYTVKVKSQDAPEKAAWDSPYFEGEKDFEIKDGEITPIGTVTALFASIKVSVSFSDDLTAAMSSDSKVDVVANDEGRLTWTATETRFGYFEAIDGSTTLVATFTGTVKGTAINRIGTSTDVARGNYYQIKFSLKTGPGMPDETGNIDPDGGIIISADIEESDENGNVDVPEEPENPNGRPDDEEWPEEPTPPTPPGPGGDDEEPFVLTPTGISLTDVVEAKAGDYILDIQSKEPLTNLKVEIISDYLTADFLQGVGLTNVFDLANPKDENGDYTEALSGFGFPVGDGVVGQTHVVFNLSPFIPLLNLADDPMVHTFRLTIIDEKGNNRTEDLKFHSDPAYR